MYSLAKAQIINILSGSVNNCHCRTFTVIQSSSSKIPLGKVKSLIQKNNNTDDDDEIIFLFR